MFGVLNTAYTFTKATILVLIKVKNIYLCSATTIVLSGNMSAVNCCLLGLSSALVFLLYISYTIGEVVRLCEARNEVHIGDIDITSGRYKFHYVPIMVS